MNATHQNIRLLVGIVWFSSFIIYWLLGSSYGWNYHPDIVLTWSRVLFISTFGVLVLSTLFRLHHIADFLKKYDEPEATAAFRIAFFGFIIIYVYFNHVAITQLYEPWLDPASNFIRKGLPPFGDIFNVIPLNSETIRIIVGMWYVSLLFSFLGVLTNYSVLLFVLSTFYLFGIPQYHAKVAHYHFLLWFPMVLCFSSSGRKWSVDFILDRFTNYRVSQYSHLNPKYSSSIAIMGILLLLSIIYFFPGFWKFWNVGLAWASPSNLQGMIADSVLDKKFSPVLHSVPDIILYAGGMFALTFELFFWYLLTERKTRLYAMTMGLLFHIFIYLFMGINFLPMTSAYICILYSIPKNDNGDKYNEQRDNFFKQLSQNVWALVIILVLIVSNFSFGALKIQDGWPFACFPTFDYLVDTNIQRLAFYSFGPSNKRLDSSEFKRQFGIARFNSIENKIIDAHHNGTLTSDFAELRFLENAFSAFFKLQRAAFVIETFELEPNSITQYAVIDTTHVYNWQPNKNINCRRQH